MWEYILIILIVLVVIIAIYMMWPRDGIYPPSDVELKITGDKGLVKWTPRDDIHTYNVYLAVGTNKATKYTIENGTEYSFTVPNPCTKYTVSVSSVSGKKESKKSPPISNPSPAGPEIESVSNIAGTLRVQMPAGGEYEVKAGSSKNDLKSLYNVKGTTTYTSSSVLLKNSSIYIEAVQIFSPTCKSAVTERYIK